MAWNNDDWQWVADGPNGGIYQNKYNPSLYANSSGGLGTKEDIMGAGSGSYTQGVDSDGSLTGVPGATYQRSPTGAISIISRPSSGSSGGGGSSNPTNVYISQNPGQLYTDRISDGSDGYPAGTILQTNNVTGAETVKYRPPAPRADPASLWNDTNSDGYDDQTGLPNGVAKVDKSISPTGLVFQGKPVNADGSLYTGGGGGNGAPDLVNGKYIWDGKKFVVAPGMESTANTNISVSGTSTRGSSSGGGGGGSSAVARDYMAENAQQAQLQMDLVRLQDQLKNDPNNPYLILQQQQLQLQMQNAARQAQKDATETQRGLINDFRSSVTDTDPSAMHAWLYANGVANGGNIVNRLSEGGDALSPNALAGTAALLQMLRAGGANVPANYTAWMQALPGLTQATAPGAPAGAPVPGATPTPMGGLGSPAPAAPPVSQSPQMAAQFQKQVDTNQIQEASAAAYQQRTGWFPNAGPGGVVYEEYVNGVPTGKTKTSDQYTQENASNDTWNVTPGTGGAWTTIDEQNQMIAALSQAQDEANRRQQVQDWTQTAPNISAGKTTATGGGATVYNMPWGWSTTNQMPSNTAQSGAGLSPAQMPAEIPYGNDQIARPLPDVQPRVTIPGLARGGNVPGMAVVGDSVSGRPTGHEELVIDPTHDARVVPLNRNALPMMQGLPHMALGGDMFSSIRSNPTTVSSLLSSWNTPTQSTGYTAPQQTTPYSTPQTSTPVPTSTQPAPVTQPVTQPQPTQPQPVAQPTAQQPIPQQPATQQPAQPAPVQMPGLTTPSGTYNTAALTPGEQALLDEARQVRETVPVPDIGGSPYNVNWNLLPPSVRDAYLKGMAAKKGINAGDYAAEIGRNQSMMPGLSRGQFQVGY